MWYCGLSFQRGNEWGLVSPSCKAHGRLPLLPVRPKNRVLHVNELPVRRELASKALRDELSPVPERRSNDEWVTRAVAQLPLAQITSPPPRPDVGGSGTPTKAESSAGPSGIRWPQVEEGWGQAATAVLPVKEVPSVVERISPGALGAGPSSGSSKSRSAQENSSGQDTDTDALIWTIVSRAAQLHRLQPKDHTPGQSDEGALQCTSDPGWSGTVPYWGTASLLHALDRIPDLGGTELGRTASGAVAPESGSGSRRDQTGALTTVPGSSWSGRPASRTTSPRQPHMDESLTGLMSCIAPSSSLAVAPEAHLANDRAWSLSAPAPARPAGSGHRPHAPAAPQRLPAVAPVPETRSAGTGDTAEQRGQQQQRQQPAALSGVVGVLLGPHIVGRSPAAALLVCAAVGVALPSWAASLLPPVPHLPTAAGLLLDPSLEWALRLLSHRVSPLEPRPGELRLANHIMASHLGPPPPPRQAMTASKAAVAAANAATHAAAAAGSARGGHGDVTATGSAPVAGGGGRGPHHAQPSSAPMLPWQLVLPVLDAVAGRLSPHSALALLRVISLQVGPDWRRVLPARDQAHLAATLQACFRVALRSPDKVSPSAAAGLLAVMSRLGLRSPPACSLLVARVLTGVVPERRTRTGTSRSAATAASATARTARAAAGAFATGDGAGSAPGAWQQAEGSGNENGTHGGEAQSGPASNLCGAGDSSSSKSRGSSNSASQAAGGGGNMSSTNDGIGRSRASRVGRSKRGRGRWTGGTLLRKRAVAGRAGRKTGGRTGGSADGSGRMALLRLRRAAQLRWVCIALSAVARLRVPHSALPQRAVTKLLWAALFASAHWTPAIAAALPVWAHRLLCRPPAAFLRRYGQVLLSSPAASPASYSSSRPTGLPPQQQPQHAGAPARSLGGAATASVGVQRGAGLPRRRLSLAERMTAAQLAGAMEALLAQYGSCTARTAAWTMSAASATARGAQCDATVEDRRSGNDSGNHNGEKSGGSSSSSSSGIGRLAQRYTRYQALMDALARLLSPRVGQLSRQQLCRLPLLLHRVWQLTEARGQTWQQVFLLRARRLLPGCDVVDCMLLLRGLAAGARAEAEAAGGAEGAGQQPGGQTNAGPAAAGTTGAEVVAAAAGCSFTWLGSELADDALRRYSALLPSASLHHTVSVLDSLAQLWGQPLQPQTQPQSWQPLQPPPPPQQQEEPQGPRAYSSPACPAPLSPPPPQQQLLLLDQSSPPTSSLPPPLQPLAHGAGRRPSTPAAVPAGLLSAPPPPPSAQVPAPIWAQLAPSTPSPEADLRRRRLSDLVLERDFLLQQLDEHVGMCLSRDSGGARGSGRNTRSAGRGGGGSRADAERRGRSGVQPEGGEVDLRSSASPGLLVVKILTAYSRMQRPPGPRLQRTLEAALIAGAEAVGTSGWQAVRAAYQQLRLQPGRELSVALLTFA
ncbi:hypothetical protein PLESTB_001393600 [Pleodorina starrii]|uniref:Uncharacterized protein n=1 Tax=Pleodorina starrii TaxID=330485 RepID=A0A9W6F6X8_9CHLO|nr:hypothetical protein PLESTM_000538700 [Pleodorina starrii]GLC58722.1 hypothetical protein PLESTB_001393600 [Pleodorina starrii]GLC75192.1 hypothetical protein PLESTF_001605400 [Pleodorina starrii]